MAKLRLSVLILALALIGIGSLSAQFSGGSGTDTDPYLVANPSDLDNIRSYYTSHFLQIADIDLDVAPYNESTGWNPIRPDLATPFSGSYNGNGYTIQGLYINNPTLSQAGLFGHVVGGLLENIVLLNVDIICHGSSGSLLGACYDTDVTGCFTSGQITGSSQDIGGMFGSVHLYSTVSRCTTDMAVNGGNYSAGMVAWVEEQCVFSDCAALGTVNGLDSCGGLIGDFIYSTLSRSYAISDITGLMVVGGLVGMCQESSTITDCFSRSNITATAFVGGISGSTYSTCSITNCYSSSSLSAGTTTGGITGGVTNSSPIVACYWDTDLSGTMGNAFGEGRTTAEMTYPYAANTYVGWDFTDVWHSDISGTQNSGYPYLWNEPTGANDENLLPLPMQVSNYPNPFHKETVLKCKTDQPGAISLSIYNLKGQRVRQLTPGFATSGEYRINWDGKDDNGNISASGIYFVRMTQQDSSVTSRLLKLK